MYNYVYTAHLAERSAMAMERERERVYTRWIVGGHIFSSHRVCLLFELDLGFSGIRFKLALEPRQMRSKLQEFGEVFSNRMHVTVDRLF